MSDIEVICSLCISGIGNGLIFKFKVGNYARVLHDF